jgi:hypothetical protein
MDNYILNGNIVDSTSTASSSPPPSATDDQIERVINALGANTRTAQDLRFAWTALSSFLEQRGALPDRVEDIGKDSLAMYAAQFRSHGSDDNTLAALSMILKRAGHSTATLAALVVKTRRVRVANRGNGRYRFERQPDRTAPSSQPGLEDDGFAITG